MPRLFKDTKILCALRMVVGFFLVLWFFLVFVRKEIKKGYLLQNQMQMVKLGFWMCVLIDEDCQMTGMNKCSFTSYT